MRGKPRVDIIFSNEQHEHQPSPSRGNRIRPFAPQLPNSNRSFEFKYTFRQYLMLLLAKILPRGRTSFVFIPQTGNIIGEEQLCKQLIARVSTEFQTKKFKTLVNITNEELDSIEYIMDESINIYRQGVIEMALRQLQKYSCFKEDCQRFRQHMIHKKLALLRVDKGKEIRTQEMINSIKHRCRQMKVEKNESVNSSSIQIEQKSLIENSVEKEKSIKNQEIEEVQEESDMVSLMQSEVNITENDSSFFHSRFCVYHQNVLKDLGKEDHKE